MLSVSQRVVCSLHLGCGWHSISRWSVGQLYSRLPAECAVHRPCGAGIEIHWGEFGVGGGTSPTGDKKATTAEEAAYTPFFGGWAGAAGNRLAGLALHPTVALRGWPGCSKQC